jgi:hypothetical protein
VKRSDTEGESYLTKYPHLLKWMNQCVACQRRGYKPEMPAEIFPGVGARNLRRYFAELASTKTGSARSALARNQRDDA